MVKKLRKENTNICINTLKQNMIDTFMATTILISVIGHMALASIYNYLQPHKEAQYVLALFLEVETHPFIPNETVPFVFSVD